MAEGFDMTASMHADLLRMCKGDKAKALQMFTGLQGQMEEEKKRSQDRKIDELAANFPGITRDALSQILAENEWDVEKAIIPCFEHQEKEREAQQKKEREEQNKRREEERRARQAEARAKATDILMQMFSNVPQDKIQALLDENEGDVDLTIDELFKQQTEQEEAQKKRKQEEEERVKQAELERRFTIDALVQKFGDYCSEAEIEAILVKNNWDVVVASRDFLRLWTLDERDIRDALYKNDWNLIETMKQLRALQAELKAKKEEEERLRAEAEARAHELAKQEAERRRIEAEAQALARAEAEAQEDRARRLAEEEAQARARAEAKAREEAEAKARTEAEAAAAAAAEEKKRAASKQAADHMLLERSIIIGKELDEIIQAQRKIAEDEADPMALVKRELEEKLKFGPENLPGMPGMVPPTRRIIDELQGRRTPPGEGPVPAAAEEAQVPPQQASSEPAKVLPTAMEFTEVETGATESKVQLRASPASLDIRRPITVEWEMESAPSSSDWIGLYRVGSDNGSYVAYDWIRPAAARGSMTFTPLEFGDYELRYFASTATFFSRQYSIKAVSNPVHVGPQVRLEPSYDAASNMLSVKIVQEAGNQYPSAWVGLYASRQETDNSRYRAFDWVTNAVDHTLSFACPKAGEWEFRLFPQRSYVDVARAAVAVGGTDSVELALEDDGRQMVVRTRLTTVDPATDHVWVGIYRTDVGEDHRQYRKYKYVAQAAGTVAFRACTTAATYEARVFANKRLDAPVARSNTIVVLPAPQ